MNSGLSLESRVYSLNFAAYIISLSPLSSIRYIKGIVYRSFVNCHAKSNCKHP